MFLQIFLSKNKKSLQAENESTPIDTAKKIFSPKIPFKSIDPRSPTTEFVRTPIIVPDDNAALPTKLHNKNLDNVRKTLVNTPLTNFKKKLPERTSPKLLESIVISPKSTEIKRKSYVGVLETNLDYIETDLDTVKPKGKLDDDVDDKLEEEMYSINESSGEEFSTPQRDTQSLKSNFKCEEICLNNLNDPRSPSAYFIRTPIELSKKLETLDVKDNLRVQECNENNDSLTPTNLNQEINKVHLETPRENQSKSETVKDFDKKLTNLIYEDAQNSVTVVKNKRVSNGRSRTPLSTKNLNTNTTRGASKLKVHDKPRKSGSEFSRIPIFQNKKGKGKFNQQCENTPPRNLDFEKIEKQKWDPNNTIII